MAEILIFDTDILIDYLLGNLDVKTFFAKFPKANRYTTVISEMEKWLLSQGAMPVTEEMKKESWYAEVSKLPPCMTLEKKQPIDRQKDATKR